MKQIRNIAVWLVLLAVGLSPNGAVFAHQDAGSPLTLVICTGDGVQTITLDQDGAPRKPAHPICHQCCLSADLPAPAPDLIRHLVAFRPAVFTDQRSSARFQMAPACPPATGPPDVI